jgi:hypothetical protein
MDADLLRQLEQQCLLLEGAAPRLQDAPAVVQEAAYV